MMPHVCSKRCHETYECPTGAMIEAGAFFPTGRYAAGRPQGNPAMRSPRTVPPIHQTKEPSMSGRVHRDFRKQANEVARQTSETLNEPIMAAIQNEAKTRERVDALEEWRDELAERDISMWRRVGALEGLRRRSFLGRLGWLLRGL